MSNLFPGENTLNVPGMWLGSGNRSGSQFLVGADLPVNGCNSRLFMCL
jgi:hypothetical protein